MSAEPRRRHRTPAGAVEHGSVGDFLASEIGDGHHEIHRGLPVDLLVAYRGSSTTVVSFHASAPDRVTQLPMLSGQGLTEAAGVNLLAIADPSLAMHPDLRLGWYLGNRPQGPFRALATPLIGHVLAQLGSTRTVFFGASGGGFAAGALSQDFPDSLALLCNPRLDLTRPPKAPIRDYLVHCHAALSATPQRRIRGEFVPDTVDARWQAGPRNTIAIIQNRHDRIFYENQFLPFAERHAASDAVFHLLRDDGEGHRHVPRPELERVITAVAASPSLGDALRELGFRTGVPSDDS